MLGLLVSTPGCAARRALSGVPGAWAHHPHAELLRHAYDGAPDGFHISHADWAALQQASGTINSRDHQIGGGAATYGELAASGVSTLAQALAIGSSSVFYDLGSGRGHVVLQMALASAAKQAIGVELSTERHRIAVHARERLGASVPAVLHRTHFECADLACVRLDDATEIFVANLLFPPELNAAVSRQMEACAPLRRVATLKPLSSFALPSFAFTGQLKLPFSWAERCKVYVYTRRTLRARYTGALAVGTSVNW